MATIAEEDTGTSSDPAIGWLSEKAKQFSDDADELRATTDRAAKGLGALATAGLTSVGIAKVGAIHPDPLDHWWPLLCLWLGFSLMVVAIVAFVYRFWRANRPLALSARLAEMSRPGNSGCEPRDADGDMSDIPANRLGTDLSPDECNEIKLIYKHAMSHAPFAGDGESLAHYERRADRLEHDTLYAPDSPASQRRLEQVARMRAEIEKAQERAKLVVVRRRMNHVFSRPSAAFLALVFIVGLLMFASAADYFASH